MLDPDTVAYSAAMTTPLTDARKWLVNTLVRGLKTDGVWSNLDWLLLFAQETSQGGRVNLRNAAKVATAANSPAFVADRGYSGNGTSAYINLNEFWHAAGNLFSQDSCTIGAWVNEQVDTTALPIVGVAGTSDAVSISAAGAGNEVYRLNDLGNGVARVSASKLGHRTIVRTGATTKRTFFDGVFGTAQTSTSQAVPTATGSFLRRNALYATGRLAAGYSGAALTDAQVAALHARLNTYLTAIGGQ